MNHAQFCTHIKTVDPATLDTYFDELTLKLKRARAPDVQLGYGLALDAIMIESRNRVFDADMPPEIAAMTLDELAAELSDFATA